MVVRTPNSGNDAGDIGAGLSTSLQSLFDEKRDEAAYIKHQAAKQLELDQARSVRMGNLDESQATTLKGRFAKAMNGGKTATDARKLASTSDVMFYMMLEQIDEDIRRLNDRIESQYGESFAEDMLNELTEAGHISDEERHQIMVIEDEAQRRQAIAKLVKEKLDNGEITEDDLKNHEWAQEWLALYEKKQDELYNAASAFLAGKLDRNEVTDDILEKSRKILKDQGMQAEEIEQEIAKLSNSQQVTSFASLNDTPDSVFG